MSRQAGGARAWTARPECGKSVVDCRFCRYSNLAGRGARGSGGRETALIQTGFCMARIDDYRESFRLASTELRKADPAALADAAGASLGANGKELRVSFLGTNYLVPIGEEVDVFREGDPQEVPLPDKILIAHYLLGAASGKKTSGELITFRQVPDGTFYFDAFQRRARDPFVGFFGKCGPLFEKCARLMGARPVHHGDFGMEFPVFPHIRVQLVLWEGDDEFAPDASILFDKSIRHYLSAEDIAVLCGAIVYRLIGLARNIQRQD